MSKRIGVFEIRLVFETDGGNFNRTNIHIMDRISQALGQVQNTASAAAFFDDKGRRLRKVEFQEGTPAMKSMVELELGTEPDVGVVA
jgi:hypothetical protein